MDRLAQRQRFIWNGRWKRYLKMGEIWENCNKSALVEINSSSPAGKIKSPRISR
jgi:hypothetical protein